MPSEDVRRSEGTLFSAMHIIIDTREQTPWTFPEGVVTEIGTLRQGDYALKGDGTFCIERKSFADFRGTVGTSDGWQRFQKEMQRMDVIGNPHKVIIVECDFAQFCFHEENGRIVEPDHDQIGFTPQLACKRIADLTLYYRASVLFAGDASCAAGLAFNILADRAVQLGGRVFPKDLIK